MSKSFGGVVFADICKEGQHPFAGIRYQYACFCCCCCCCCCCCLLSFVVVVVVINLTVFCHFDCFLFFVVSLRLFLFFVDAVPSCIPRASSSTSHGLAWLQRQRTIHLAAPSPSCPLKISWRRYLGFWTDKMENTYCNSRGEERRGGQIRMRQTDRHSKIAK